MIRAIACMIAVVLMHGALGAQQAPVIPQEKKDELRDVGNTAYPDFVSRPGAPLPESPDEGTTATLEGESVPQDRPQLLVDDLASSTTWTRTRARIVPGMDEVRMLMLASANPEEVEAAADKVMEDIDLVLRMAPFQAPTQEEGLAIQRDRIERQLELIVDDYAARRLKQMQNTDELLRVSLDEFSRLLLHSDLERGSASAVLRRIPEDWNVGRFRAPDFAARVSGWSADQLLGAYTERIGVIESALRSKRPPRDSRIGREMGELARQLAGRAYEVPLTSQPAFRNSALRLDVLAENLDQYIRDENGPYAKRQLRFMRYAVRDCQAYLELRRQGL